MPRGQLQNLEYQPVGSAVVIPSGAASDLDARLGWAGMFLVGFSGYAGYTCVLLVSGWFRGGYSAFLLVSRYKALQKTHVTRPETSKTHV